MRLRSLLVLVMWLAAVAARAEVRMPAIFGDNMVLQAGMAQAPVWGWADPGEAVTVTFKDARAAATAKEDGTWRTALDLSKADHAIGELTVAGKNTLTFKNVVAGEVWVCSGQSNMAFTVNRADNFEAEAKAANFPMLRCFTVQRGVSPDKALSDVKGAWEVCTPETVGRFTAAGYFFGRELHQRLGAPVGLIHTSVGGTPAEAWISMEATRSENPMMKAIMARQAQELAKAAVAQKAAATKKASAAKKKAPARTAAKAPAQPNGKARPTKAKAALRRAVQPFNLQSTKLASTLYNAMVAGLVPYGIKGAIWYQGEANAGRAYQYRELFPALIRDWRRAWGQGDFPFYFVQLANYMAKTPEPGESDWAELREAQLMTLKVPNTGMAVIIDIGMGDNIHPTNKQDVGKRLAQWALHRDYGQDVVESGPLFESMSVNGGVATVKFEYATGLTAKGAKLAGFAVAGADKKFVWADAKIVGDAVEVSSPQVKEPVAVRYGWANNPDCNLYNGAGLPASPFRTDDWPGGTVGKN